MGLGSKANNPIVLFLVNVVRLCHPDIFCSWETKADVKKVSARLQFLGYPYTTGVEPEGFAYGLVGNLMLFWIY